MWWMKQVCHSTWLTGSLVGRPAAKGISGFQILTLMSFLRPHQPSAFLTLVTSDFPHEQDLDSVWPNPKTGYQF